MFAGKSVGDLSITGMIGQRMVYYWLTDLNFTGVLATHCEKESLLRPDLWDPTNPISHCSARPKEAEIESVGDQIQFATEAGFAGWLHICHVSCPESVCLVDEARASGLRISCGATPHHLKWYCSMMDRGEDGLLYKTNPPLRSIESMAMLRNQLAAGMIDLIEVDHAPHTMEEKMGPPYLSGYPSLELYREFVTEFLPRRIGISAELVKALTHDNAIKIFGDKLKIAA
jgi:dihydroorotase